MDLLLSEQHRSSPVLASLTIEAIKVDGVARCGGVVIVTVPGERQNPDSSHCICTCEYNSTLS